ncbi:MAG TPA: hypothetical protein VN936_01435 [Candidatus Acidoferrum sp.]|nr:hypothetical protein [Candidatus Acidoferrum sp.]
MSLRSVTICRYYCDGLAFINAKATVDWVVTNGHRAIAAWHANNYRGYVTLAYQDNRWWWTAAATRGSPLSDATKSYWSRIYYGPGLGECGGHDPYGPAAKDFLLAGLINDAIERSVESRLRTEPLPSTQLEVEATCYRSLRRDFVSGYEALQSNQTPEGVSLQFGRRGLGESADLTSIGSRFDFLLATEIYDKSEAPKAFAVRALKVSIWAPFVLDKQNKYSLIIRDVAPQIAPLPGSVTNNVIQFTVPAFEMQTGAVARGEVRVYR